MATDPHSNPRARKAGRGRIASQPEGPYIPAQRLHDGPDGGLLVEFHGEDGRSNTYDFSRWPDLRLTRELAAGFADRAGPTGSRRTESSANHAFSVLQRFALFLGGLAQPPTEVADLRVRHIQRYIAHRLQAGKPNHVRAEIGSIGTVLLAEPVRDRLDPELADHIRHNSWGWVNRADAGGQPGYSDREFAAIMAAARSDVVAIRERLRASARLLERFENDPGALGEPERALAAALAPIALTGRVPEGWHREKLPGSPHQKFLAQHLFLTLRDLAPLLVLGVGLTGRNVETLKELSCEFRDLEGRAVGVDLVKRRRGKAMSRAGVHWEIGAESRQLHTAGGFYLLVEQLSRSSRRFSGSETIWSIWTIQQGKTITPRGAEYRRFKASTGGHIDPFARTLGRELWLSRWVERHGLVADGDGAAPLQLTMNRLKTTVEVRTARAAGGHLPSASRSNTFDVSFLHYLRNDPRIREWAEKILTTALEDAQHSAESFQVRILDDAGRRDFERDPEVVASKMGTTAETIKQAVNGDLDTLASACLDFEHSPPSGGGVCEVSFLTCLRCPNALVTDRHLPMLLALADWLQAELDRSTVEAWCGRHGITWLIITRMVLPRFTQAQTDLAQASKPRLPIELLTAPAGR